jgi:hypothetical protein
LAHCGLAKQGAKLARNVQETGLTGRGPGKSGQLEAEAKCRPRRGGALICVEHFTCRGSCHCLTALVYVVGEIFGVGKALVCEGSLVRVTLLLGPGFGKKLCNPTHTY